MFFSFSCDILNGLIPDCTVIPFLEDSSFGGSSLEADHNRHGVRPRSRWWSRCFVPPLGPPLGSAVLQRGRTDQCSCAIMDHRSQLVPNSYAPHEILWHTARFLIHGPEAGGPVTPGTGIRIYKLSLATSCAPVFRLLPSPRRSCPSSVSIDSLIHSDVDL